MKTAPNIKARPAIIEDKEFIVALIPRLTEFGPAGWRDAGRTTGKDIEVLSDRLLDQPPGTAIFIAEDGEIARRAKRRGKFRLKMLANMARRLL